MKVALTIWGNRISPVFDSARKLLIVEVENNKVANKQYELFNSEIDSDLTQFSNLGINVLICGAISRRFSNIIETSKIKLIPFITGHADVVLKSYVKNNKIGADFFMPGCGNKCKEVNMPRSDGTGPQGKGVGTGRNQGPCQGKGPGRGQGQRSGKGQGRGRGTGQDNAQGIGRGQGKGQDR